MVNVVLVGEFLWVVGGLCKPNLVFSIFELKTIANLRFMTLEQKYASDLGVCHTDVRCVQSVWPVLPQSLDVKEFEAKISGPSLEPNFIKFLWNVVAAMRGKLWRLCVVVNQFCVQHFRAEQFLMHQPNGANFSN